MRSHIDQSESCSDTNNPGCKNSPCFPELRYPRLRSLEEISRVRTEDNSIPRPHSADKWPELGSGCSTMVFCPNLYKLGFSILTIFCNFKMYEKGKNEFSRM